MKREMKRTESGQVLVLFALSIVALLGLLALAIDVSRVYAQERYQRTVSDAASLAGAQDLFQDNSRDVPSGGPANARKHAMDLLVRQLGASSTPDAATCNQNCPLPGTPYTVWITTPSPTCVACDPNRSVQVTVKYATFGLTFARVFGQNQWAISTTSVAGLTASIRYAMVTLRPSYSPSGRSDPAHDQNLYDIDANGQTTVVHIVNGDIGTNTSVGEQLTPVGTPPLCAIQLDAGFSIYHLSTYDTWCTTGTPAAPRGILTQQRIPDPGYVSDARFGQIRDGLALNGSQDYPAQHALGSASCAVDGVTAAPSQLGLTTICYRPGYYPRYSGQAAFDVGNGELAYLLPGTYFFNGNVTVGSGMLLGGNTPSRPANPPLPAVPAPGVALLFPSNVTFKTSAGASVSLNMGGTSCADDSCRAAAPNDTPFGPLLGVANVPLTVVVQRISACFTGLDPTNGDCSESNVINLSGGASVAVAGIMYAPSDHVTVGSANGAQAGTMGLIISWWVTYSGNTALNQSYPGLFETGVLRIDSACTKGSPVMPCNAP